MKEKNLTKIRSVPAGILLTLSLLKCYSNTFKAKLAKVLPTCSPSYLLSLALLSPRVWHQKMRWGPSGEKEQKKSNSCPDTQQMTKKMSSIPGTRKKPKSHILGRNLCKKKKKYEFQFQKVFLITLIEGNGRAEVGENIPMVLLFVMMMLTKLFWVLAVPFSIGGGSDRD